MQKKYTTPIVPDRPTYPSIDRRIREAGTFRGMRREEQVKVTLRLTVSQSVCLGHDQMFLLA
jgi:hypothetical protein